MAPVRLVDRAFARAEPNRLWVCDIKYVQTGQGYLFLPGGGVDRIRRAPHVGDSVAVPVGGVPVARAGAGGSASAGPAAAGPQRAYRFQLRSQASASASDPSR